MPTNTQPQLLTRTTTRRVVHLVTTIREVYLYPTPPKQVFETTGVDVTDARPSAPVVPLRRATGSRGFALARVLGLLAVFAALLALVSLTACGGADAPTTSEALSAAGAPPCAPPPVDSCWYAIGECIYSTPMLGAGTRELSCAASIDWNNVTDVKCGDDRPTHGSDL
jgi:hypothetical protein